MKTNTKNCFKCGSSDPKMNADEWQCKQCGLLFSMFGGKA